MKKSIYSVVLSLLLTLTFSCTQTKYPEVVDGLDSLRNALLKSQEQLKNIDFEAYEKMSETVKEDFEYVAKNYKDTVNADMAFTLAAYYKIYTYGKAEEEEEGESGKKSETEEEKEEGKVEETLESRIREELDKSFTQIKSLRNDVKSNFLDSGKVREYFETEAYEARKISIKVEKTQQAIEIYKHFFDSIKPKIDSIKGKIKPIIEKAS